MGRLTAGQHIGRHGVSEGPYGSLAIDSSLERVRFPLCADCLCFASDTSLRAVVKALVLDDAADVPDPRGALVELERHAGVSATLRASNWSEVKRRRRPARKHKPFSSITGRIVRSGKPRRSAASRSLMVSTLLIS